MDAAIDRLRHSGERTDQSPLFRQLFPKLSSEPVVVSTWSPTATLRALLGLLPNAAPQLLQAVTVPGDGGVAGVTFVQADSMVSVLRVTLAELVALRKSAPALGAAVPLIMMRQPPPSGNPPQSE
jgi:hypothetical protein